MIRNINTNFFKNSKLKLCTIGTVGIILSASLVGCVPTSIEAPENNYNITESAEELLNQEKATINLEYEGLENITERDIITFSNPETAKILGIAATDKDLKELTLPPGEYRVTSNYLEEEYFEIKKSAENWNVEANYNTNTFTITENIKEKVSIK